MNPFDSLKDTGLKNDLLKEEINYEELNPFSNFFNKDLAKQVIEKAYKGEFDRLNNSANEVFNRTKNRAVEDYNLTKTGLGEDDSMYRTQEAKQFERALAGNAQNYANSGAFFSGAREGQEDLLEEDRQVALNDYSRRFAQQVAGLDRQNNRFTEDLNFNKSNDDFERQRQQRRIVDEQLQAAEDEKRAYYEDERQRYYENPLYKGTAAGDAKLNELRMKKDRGFAASEIFKRFGGNNQTQMPTVNNLKPIDTNNLNNKYKFGM